MPSDPPAIPPPGGGDTVSATTGHTDTASVTSRPFHRAPGRTGGIVGTAIQTVGGFLRNQVCYDPHMQVKPFILDPETTTGAVETAMILTSDFQETLAATKVSHLLSLFELSSTASLAALEMFDPSYIDWLLQSHAALTAHFGAEAKFVLDAIDDPDIAGNTQLAVYIKTRIPVDEAMRRLEQFDNDWFFDQIDFVGNKIFFNLAFV